MSETELAQEADPALSFVEKEEGMTTLQRREGCQCEDVLGRFFGLATNSVEGEMPVCWDRRDLRKRVRPDVFVAFGVPDRIREEYLPWKEGKPPDWVLEIASRSTADEDRGPKLGIYHRIGAPEVVLFDPEGLYHDEVLQLFVREEQSYRQAAAVREGRIISPTLGLEMESVAYYLDKVRNWTLRFRDPKTGQLLPTDKEVAAEVERLSREKEAQAAEIARLRAELQALRGER